MKYLNIAAVFILFCTIHRCFAPALTITAPGLYELGDNITFSPSVADSIISIQTSDVTLDLGGRILDQINTTTGVDGISVASGLSNIIIRNGSIRNVTNRGIFVDTSTANTARLTISDLVFTNCQNRGISFEGGFNAENCIIDHCQFINCTLSATGDFVINLASGTTQNSRISDIFIGNEGTPAIPGGARALIRTGGLARSCVFQDILAEEINASAVNVTGFLAAGQFITNLVENVRFSSLNTGAANTYIGFSLQSITATNSFINCNSSRCSAGTASHFSLTGVPSNNLFTSCIAQGVSSSNQFDGFNLGTSTNSLLFNCTVAVCASGGTGPLNGFTLGTTATGGNLFLNCIVEGCTAGGTSPFNGFVLSTHANSNFIDCIVQNCTTTVACTPFSLTSGTRCALIRCNALNNSSTSGVAANAYNGFSFSVCNLCSARDCFAIGGGGNNTGRGFLVSNCTNCAFDSNGAYQNIGAITTRGFELVGGAVGLNAFISNVALANGGTTANQFVGFAAAQVQQFATTAVTSITAPLINAGLAG